jgi:hypothetical protein
MHTKFKYRWDDVNMDLMEIGWEGGNWMHQAQHRGQWQAHVRMNVQVP